MPEQTTTHQPQATPLYNIKLERNSKGYNWEITVINAPTVADALAQLTIADNQLRAQYAPAPKES